MRRTQVAILGCIIIVSIAVAYLFPKSHEKTLPLSILNNCFSSSTATSKSPWPDDECLKKSVNSLLEDYSTVDLMNYIVATTTPYGVTNYCHAAAHIIGQETFIKTGDVEQAVGACSRNCNYGCVHGVIAAGVAKDLGTKYLDEDIVHANPAKVEEVGAKYCTKGSKALCHAMGHILYIGAQDITASLRGCEKIGGPETATNCATGVFMEASGLSNAIIKSAKIPDRKDNDYAYPCNSVETPYRHTCFLYLTNFQKQLFIRNDVADNEQFNIVRSVCESFSDARSRSGCFLGVGNIFLNRVEDDNSANPLRPSLCETLSGTDQDSCVVGLALKNSQLNRYGDALNYCSGRSTEKRIALCYNAVFQTMSDARFSNESIRARCDASNAIDLCGRQYEAYLSVAKTLPQYYVEGLFGNPRGI